MNIKLNQNEELRLRLSNYLEKIHWTGKIMSPFGRWLNKLGKLLRPERTLLLINVLESKRKLGKHSEEQAKKIIELEDTIDVMELSIFQLESVNQRMRKALVPEK